MSVAAKFQKQRMLAEAKADHRGKKLDRRSDGHKSAKKGRMSLSIQEFALEKLRGFDNEMLSQSMKVVINVVSRA